MPDKDCPFCSIIASPTDPTFVCDLGSSFVLVDFQQRDYPGSALIVLKEHHEHMHELPHNLLHAFIDERAQLAKAILKAFPDVIRINYANMGNATPHVHEYLIPRRANDRNAGGAPWPVEPAPQLTDEQYKDIADALRRELNVTG